MDPGSAFFTAISRTTIAEGKMKIPPAIATNMQALSTNPVILRDRYRNLWPVEVAKDRAGMYFEEGWMKLCEEYSLEPGDTMVFEYRDNNMFDFKLLGINACEKECVGGLKFTVKEEEEEEGEAAEEEEDDTEEVEEEEEDDDDDDDDDDDTELEDSYDEDEEHVENEEEHEDDDDEQDNTSRKVNLKSKSKTNHAGSSSLNRGHTIGAATSPKKGEYRKSNLYDWYAADLFKSGVVPQPKNPYFVSKSRAAHRFYELCIPRNVIKDFKLKIPDELYLVDTNGRKWGTKIKKWGDGRVWIGRGWKSLCSANLIDMDDVCICEFVQEEGSNDLNIFVKVVGK